MKLPIILLTAFCFAISDLAAMPSYATIYKKDDTATKLIFSNNLRVTCPDTGTLRFSDGSGMEIEISHSDIHHISYVDDTTSTDMVEISDKIRVDGRRLVISTPNGTEAQIFDTAGRLLMNCPCTENTIVDMSVFPSGIYIVTVGTLRLKFRL